MSLSGKVAIVTGSSRGLGKAIAITLAQAGADVVVAARTEAEGGPLPGTIQQTAEAIRALGRRALAVKTDVSKDEDAATLAQLALEEFGRADILVNNAGAFFRGSIADTPVRRWDLMMGVNLRGPFLLIKALIPTMIGQKYGHIINISPPPSLRLAPGGLAQSLSKVGLTLFSLGLSEELKEHNIAVNCLWPAGGRDTEGMRVLPMRSNRSEWLSPQITADATLAIVNKEPSIFTGKALTDEETLREAGTSDFSKYRIS